MPARILIVDDEPDVEFLIRKKFRRKINANELDFCFAQNGLQALETLENDSNIDLVLTDINMPHMDGLTLIQKIQRFDINVKTVVVSAYDDMTNIRKAMNFGAFDFITKPIDFQDFENTIYKTLLERGQELKAENLELTDALKELREAQQQLFLREKMASLGNLVAGISHEINTPIGVINSAADVIARCIEKVENATGNAASEEILASLEKTLPLLKENNRVAKEAGVRISKIVASLKEFSKLDAEEYQNSNLHENIENILILIENELDDRISIVKDFTLIPQIYCSPSQINQVFMNIIRNAIQAIKENGTVRISTALEDRNIIIKISDNGEGIAENQLSRLFDFGFNRKSSRVKMGLGLPVSFHIIQKHNGDIFIDSTVGIGTEVTIKLPQN